MDEEAWKSIPDYPYHEASNLGRIRSITRMVPRTSFDGVKRDMHIKSRLMKQNPLQAKRSKKPTALTLRLLHKSGKWKTVYGHHIVLFAFVGPKPDGMECCHYDGNALNNRLGNLRWDTPESNRADMDRHGTRRGNKRCGQDHACAKLTNAQIIEIVRSPWGKRGIGSAFAKRFGVGNTAIYGVRSRYRKRPDLLKTIEESIT